MLVLERDNQSLEFQCEILEIKIDNLEYWIEELKGDLQSARDISNRWQNDYLSELSQKLVFEKANVDLRASRQSQAQGKQGGNPTTAPEREQDKYIESLQEKLASLEMTAKNSQDLCNGLKIALNKERQMVVKQKGQIERLKLRGEPGESYLQKSRDRADDKIILLLRDSIRKYLEDICKQIQDDQSAFAASLADVEQMARVIGTQEDCRLMTFQLEDLTGQLQDALFKKEQVVNALNAAIAQSEKDRQRARDLAVHNAALEHCTDAKTVERFKSKANQHLMNKDRRAPQAASTTEADNGMVNNAALPANKDNRPIVATVTEDDSSEESPTVQTHTTTQDTKAKHQSNQSSHPATHQQAEMEIDTDGMGSKMPASLVVEL